MKALNKPNLIIITGEQGSGKSTYARKHYPHLTIIDDVINKTQILGYLKTLDKVVVCCLPEVVYSLIPDKDSGIAYQIITLKNFEVVQMSGRGFNPSKWQQRDIVAAEVDLHQQLAKAKAEVKRIEEEIEESKIKVGDVCKFWDNNENSFVIGVVQHIYENARLKYETIFDCQFPNAEKITNPELIKLLEDESRTD